jgi:glutathione S-transferase
MKIYDFKGAPNPRRVRIFLAEKTADMVYVQVDIFAGHNRAPEFLSKNPLGGLPVLEFDDGTYLAESVAICRYFEGIYPEPPLMGINPKDAAFVEMWNRRMELELFGPLSTALLHSHPMFKERMQQFPEFAATQREHALKRAEWLDSLLAQREFVAGDRYTIADITAQVAVDFAQQFGVMQIPEHARHLKRWHQAVSKRPSAQA